MGGLGGIEAEPRKAKVNEEVVLLTCTSIPSNVDGRAGGRGSKAGQAQRTIEKGETCTQREEARIAFLLLAESH